MRIALISTANQHAGEANVSLMPLAGRSVARRQLDLALALGAERIVCVADTPTGETVRLQHAAERAGVKFSAITGPRALVGLARAADELLVMGPGVLSDARLVREALADRAGILALPAESAVPAGFERIDSEAAWGGFLIVQGSAAERLADLPGDGDPVSGLLRIALQLGTRRVVLATASVDAGDLALIRDAETLAQAEQRWLQTSAPALGWRMPGVALTDRLARLAARRALARGRGLLAVRGAGAALAVAAGAFAWLERPAASLAALMLAAMAFVTARTWQQIERGEPAGPGGRSEVWPDLLLDALLLASTIAAVPRFPGFAAFSAAVLVLSIRLAAAGDARSLARSASDRIAILAALALAAAFGKLLPAVQIFALAALALNLLDRLRTPANAGLTTPR